MHYPAILHPLIHSFIHSQAPSPGLILDIQEQVIKTHCLAWGAPSFQGWGWGGPPFASQPLIIQPGCSHFCLSYLPCLAPGGGHLARGPSTPGPLSLSSPPLHKGQMSGSRRGFYTSAGRKRGACAEGSRATGGQVFTPQALCTKWHAGPLALWVAKSCPLAQGWAVGP